MTVVVVVVVVNKRYPLEHLAHFRGKKKAFLKIDLSHYIQVVGSATQFSFETYMPPCVEAVIER